MMFLAIVAVPLQDHEIRKRLSSGKEGIFGGRFLQKYWPYYELCTLIYGQSALVRPPERLHLGSWAMVPLGTLLQFPDPDRVFSNMDLFSKSLQRNCGVSPLPNHWSNTFDTLSLGHCSICAELVNLKKKGPNLQSTNQSWRSCCPLVTSHLSGACKDVMMTL